MDLGGGRGAADGGTYHDIITVECGDSWMKQAQIRAKNKKVAKQKSTRPKEDSWPHEFFWNFTWLFNYYQTISNNYQSNITVVKHVWLCITTLVPQNKWGAINKKKLGKIPY